MADSSIILLATASSVGVVHTLLGPDHYLPFVAMARAEKWSLRRTLRVAVLCGLGHVLGSVVLGCIGIAVGLGLFRLERIEAYRGDLAGWLLIAGGLVYLVWGVRHAIRRRPHTHAHVHADGTIHKHEHSHVTEHVHLHRAEGTGSRSPLFLFAIFILGPCEPLIPLLMFPASKGRILDVALVASLYAVGTLVTMLTAIVVCLRVTSLAHLDRFERFGHAIAGAVVLACGIAVRSGL